MKAPLYKRSWQEGGSVNTGSIEQNKNFVQLRGGENSVFEKMTK